MIDFNLLNSSLSELEKIISSKYHFTFSDLNEDSVNPTDIMVSVMQARVIAEGVCRYIVLHEHLVKDEKSIRTATLKVYIEDLLRPNLLVPKTIISNLLTIQSKSNLAVHYQVDGHLDEKEAYICLESLEQIIYWFMKNYGSAQSKGNKWKISSDILNRSGSIPPKSEGCILSREKDVKGLHELLTTNPVVFLRGHTGVGKTEMIKDYIKKYRKRYDGVYYTENVFTMEDFIYNLPIGIIDDDVKTKAEVIDEKIDVVHSMGLVYLFIIDNYLDDIEKLKSFRPLATDRYKVLVLVGDEFEINEKSEVVYNLNVFSKQNSMQIFKYFCKENYRDEEIGKLLDYLLLNPRAIRMSATFLNGSKSYTPDDLIGLMQKNHSVNSIIRNLYIVLTEITILEKDEAMRVIAKCLSLIPYNGVSKDRFKSLLFGVKCLTFDDEEFERVWSKLKENGWIIEDNMEIITINPLLSDVVFEKTCSNMSEQLIVEFVMPLLTPIKTIRELYMSQIVALEPFVEHLTRRAEQCNDCDLKILNELREYYIAIYDLQRVEIVTQWMEREFKEYKELYEENVIERAKYRQGMSRFNMEDFVGAHDGFSQALTLYDEKLVRIKSQIAMICAYEGTSLATMGFGDLAVETVKRSIDLRKELKEDSKLWISYYNYAKVLLILNQYEKSGEICEIAIEQYRSIYPDLYKKREGTNFSSLIQLKGRILAKLAREEEAIDLLEEAKDIREKLKGDNYFSTAQIYSYLMEVYASIEKYDKALFYAKKYHSVLIMQTKTDDILGKISELNGKIKNYMEKNNGKNKS